MGRSGKITLSLWVQPPFPAQAEVLCESGGVASRCLHSQGHLHLRREAQSLLPVSQVLYVTQHAGVCLRSSSAPAFQNQRGTLPRVQENLWEGLEGWECARQALGATGASSRCPPVLTAGLAFSIGPMLGVTASRSGRR